MNQPTTTKTSPSKVTSDVIFAKALENPPGIPKGETLLPAHIDSSTLSAWRSCRRKYFWQTLNALYPSGKSVHLTAGGAFAAGMEAARKLVFQRDRDSRPSFDDILEASFKAFLGSWGDYSPPENSNKSFVNTWESLVEYLQVCPPETDNLQPYLRPDGSPTVEFSFSIPLLEAPRHPETNNPFIFAGRFDLLGTYNGLHCIADEKTTSALGFTWPDQWQLRGQFMGYLWACQQLGYEVNTAVVRGICILKKETKFATAIEQYPQHLIDRWYRQLLLDVERIVASYNLWKDAGSQDEEIVERCYPYNFADACTSYGGCAYINLCKAATPSDWFSNYSRYRWNPLTRELPEELPNAPSI